VTRRRPGHYLPGQAPPRLRGLGEVRMIPA